MHHVGPGLPKQANDVEQRHHILGGANRPDQIRKHMTDNSKLSCFLEEKSVFAGSHFNLAMMAEASNQIENMCLPAAKFGPGDG